MFVVTTSVVALQGMAIAITGAIRGSTAYLGRGDRASDGRDESQCFRHAVTTKVVTTNFPHLPQSLHPTNKFSSG
ncbi:hypothetical protein [Laspinema palackyanum]|uniref:hypothetical protein n=1 Tax=Laspinema palackyanum TaxID=3231601 RepID=UPI00345C9813|nr:hypothetical protein [Laspinema sp. D2c]